MCLIEQTQTRCGVSRAVAQLTVLASLMLFLPGRGWGQQLKVDNTYSNQGTVFAWKVFIAEDTETLAKIKFVTYRLHPTFTPRTRSICDSREGFALYASGWGEFTLILDIEWQDRHLTRQAYDLDLHSPARRRPSVSPNPSPKSNHIQAPLFASLDDPLRGVLERSIAGQKLYDDLDDLAKTQLLNIYCENEGDETAQ